MKKLIPWSIFTLLALLAVFSVASKNQSPTLIPNKASLAIATFAGGCFWCVEADFEKLTGVVEVISGFSGGHVANPSYEQVSAGGTGHIESVQVYYDPQIISYGALLEAFWRQVDPTDNGGQFVDRGESYITTIFSANDAERVGAERSKNALGALKKYAKPVITAIRAVEKFYPAEDYHQDYYKKNPLRYRYYRSGSGRDQFLAKIWANEEKPKNARSRYRKPPDSELRERLTKLQYRVTQEESTESPFNNTYWDEKAEGIYVDIVSGEPLFSSQDKFKSGTGWPSFSRALKAEHVVESNDYRLVFPRTEVRSRDGDSHLGHLFKDGPEPTGLRYCINSAALKFVPKEQLLANGYGEFASRFPRVGDK